MEGNGGNATALTDVTSGAATYASVSATANGGVNGDYYTGLGNNGGSNGDAQATALLTLSQPDASGYAIASARGGGLYCIIIMLTAALRQVGRQMPLPR